ncbi:VOC family protein [Pseudactinotalea sp.]|uniref:VOC family protein n=1 Tax=Pseudactinotalea sp. TaxID=1926260 RepID=UPI003B3A7F20
MEKFTASQVLAMDGLADWRVMLGALRSRFVTPDMSAGAAFVARMVEAANAANHHPDLQVSYGHVDVDLTTHDAGGLTSRDVDMARTISALAAEAGLDAEPAQRQVMEYAVDALDIDAVRPFWVAVTGLEPDERGDLPAAGTGVVAVWFQQMDQPRPQRNRIHLDVTVPLEEAEGRVAAAVAAGGTLLSDAAAPRFWVLADAEGNEVCVCTAAGRD